MGGNKEILEFFRVPKYELDKIFFLPIVNRTSMPVPPGQYGRGDILACLSARHGGRIFSQLSSLTYFNMALLHRFALETG